MNFEHIIAAGQFEKKLKELKFKDMPEWRKYWHAHSKNKYMESSIRTYTSQLKNNNQDMSPPAKADAIRVLKHREDEVKKALFQSPEWCWENDAKQMQSYISEQQEKLEEAFAAGKQKLKLGVYEIDFERSLQKNVKTGYTRKITRAGLPVRIARARPVALKPAGIDDICKDAFSDIDGAIAQANAQIKIILDTSKSGIKEKQEAEARVKLEVDAIRAEFAQRLANLNEELAKKDAELQASLAKNNRDAARIAELEAENARNLSWKEKFKVADVERNRIQNQLNTLESGLRDLSSL